MFTDVYGENGYSTGAGAPPPRDGFVIFRFLRTAPYFSVRYRPSGHFFTTRVRKYVRSAVRSRSTPWMSLS